MSKSGKLQTDAGELTCTGAAMSTLRAAGVLVRNSVRAGHMLVQLALVAGLALAGTHSSAPLERLYDLLSGCGYFVPGDVDYRRLFAWLMPPALYVLDNATAIDGALEVQRLSIPRQGSMLRFGMALWLRSLVGAVVWSIALSLAMSALDTLPHMARGGSWSEVAASAERLNIWPMLVGYASGLCALGGVQTAAHLMGGSAQWSCVAALGLLLLPLYIEPGAMSFALPGNMMMIRRYRFVCAQGSASLGACCAAAVGYMALSALVMAVHSRASRVRMYAE